MVLFGCPTHEEGLIWGNFPALKSSMCCCSCAFRHFKSHISAVPSLRRRLMNLGRTVFSQLVDFLPTYQFQICVDRYQGNRYVKDFSCWDQFLCLAFAQLTYRESLRDIEACL